MASSSLQLEFANAAMKGCTFYWTQCLWRRVDVIIIIIIIIIIITVIIIIITLIIQLFMYLQVQHEGLQTAYMEDAATNTLIKKFLVLHMLPSNSLYKEAVDRHSALCSLFFKFY